MADAAVVTAAATRLTPRNEEDLVLLAAMRDEAIKKNPALAEDVDFEPKYDSNTMGPPEALKALGRRILRRWSRELQAVVCGNKAEDKEQRDKIMAALNISAGAAAGVIAATLAGTLMVPAAVAVAIAPIIAK